MAESRKLIHIIYRSISIADIGVGARGDWTPKASALGCVVLALQAGWRSVRYEIPSSLSCAERGTGLDQPEGELSPVGPGDRGAGPVALSSLVLNISALHQGVPASHRAGFKTAIKMRLFLGSGVPFSLIHR